MWADEPCGHYLIPFQLDSRRQSPLYFVPGTGRFGFPSAGIFSIKNRITKVGGQAIQKKTPHLIYDVDERPPGLTLVLLGIEHAFLLVASLIATVFFARSVGATLTQTESLVNVGLIAGGVASILQATRAYGLGSGYFCLHTSSYIYFQSSVVAAKVGGLPLVFGMTAVAGLFETLLSRFISKLRVFFPTEVAGLVVAMVGIAMVPYAMRSLAGLTPGDATINVTELTVGVITLVLIMGINVWTRGNFRLYSVLIGIAAGYILAWLTGLLSTGVLAELWALPLAALPHIEHPGFAFDLSLLMPFLVAALCAALKLVGDLITCQKINDENWKRAEMESVGRGLVADGLGTTLAGLLAGTGLSSSSSNIGMAYATGATSRVIAYATGIIFIALAFMPRIAALFSLMPMPVVGAIVIYAACFMIVTGWSIVMTRMLDARKTFTIGLALILGLSVEIIPELFRSVPQALRPIFDSSIAVAALSAILLNMFFRIGISSRMTLRLRIKEDSGEAISTFFERAGSVWGRKTGGCLAGHVGGHRDFRVAESFVRHGGRDPGGSEL